MMYCHECGKELLEGSEYCCECGKKVIKIEDKFFVLQSNELSLKEEEKQTADNVAHYKGIIICALIILISALVLPIYYFENSPYHVWVKFWGNNGAIRTYFGSSRGIPMIRYNTFALIILILSSIVSIVEGCKRQVQHTTKGFVVILCTMILHLIIQVVTLSSKGIVAIGFFAIIITSIIGATLSRKCNQRLLIEGEDIES